MDVREEKDWIDGIEEPEDLVQFGPDEEDEVEEEEPHEGGDGDSEEEGDEEEEEEDEAELGPEMRQFMMMMQMMERQQIRCDQRRDKEMKKLLESQQAQHRKTLKALRPKETIDQSIPLPRRIDGDQTISEYLVGFEKIMRERGTPVRKWPAILPSLLNRKYNQALSNLNEEETDDYEKVKEALLAVDVEDLLMAPRRFFEAQKKQGEDFHRFCQKLETYWYHVTKAVDTVKKMRQKTVIERFITFLPHQCATAVRDQKPETTNAAVNYAKEYFVQKQWNIANYLGHGKWAETTNRRRQDNPRRQGGGYRQYQRSRPGHRGDQQSGEEKSAQTGQQQMPETKPEDKKPEEAQKGASKYTYKPTCFTCGKVGHTRKFCRSKPDVNLVQLLGKSKIDDLVTTSGIVEGKEVHDIALDTGADVCVISSDLVPADTEQCGTQVTGTIGGDFKFPKVVVHTTIQGREQSRYQGKPLRRIFYWAKTPQG